MKQGQNKNRNTCNYWYSPAHHHLKEIFFHENSQTIQYPYREVGGSANIRRSFRPFKVNLKINTCNKLGHQDQCLRVHIWRLDY